MGARSNRTEELNRIIHKIFIDYIEDADACRAISEIFLDDTITSVNWNRAAAILHEYVPDMFNHGFSETITYQQIADVFEDENGDGDWFLDYVERLYKVSPTDTVDFDDAVNAAYDFCRDAYTDGYDDENYAYAKTMVRTAFKNNTTY